MDWIAANWPLFCGASAFLLIWNLWRVALVLWRTHTERVDCLDPPRGVYLQTEYGDKHYLLASYHGRRRFGSRMKGWVIRLDDGIARDVAEGRLQVHIDYLPKRSVLLIQGTL